MKFLGKHWYLSDEEVVEAALQIMLKKFTGGNEKYTEQLGMDYLRLLLCNRDIEVFCCIFMDSNLNVIAIEEMFVGSVDQVKVHAREVVKRSIDLKSTSVVVCHNHPNGEAKPSEEDIEYTNELKQGLKLMEITLLDHIIVANSSAISMKKSGAY